jgi:predicted metalloprotease
VTLSRQLEAKGDFPATYVIAHEVPHHVQNELRILGQVHLAHQQSSQTDANAPTVRLELQADCHSGVWARAAVAYPWHKQTTRKLVRQRLFQTDDINQCDAFSARRL